MKTLLALPFLLIAGCADAKEPAEAEPTAAASSLRGADALLTSLTDPRQMGRYAPRDECGTAPGATAFRQDLAKAVAARDADALVALSDPDILLDFGGGEGTEELRARLASPEWELWQVLEKLLPLGCSLGEEGWLTMPWYFAQDFGERDPFMLMIVRGEGVPLLAEAKDDAPVLAKLSWEAVDLDESADNESAWAKVHDYNGIEGYIAWDSLRSLIDYRLLAEKTDGKWKLTAFVAGD